MVYKNETRATKHSKYHLTIHQDKNAERSLLND